MIELIIILIVNYLNYTKNSIKCEYFMNLSLGGFKLSFNTTCANFCLFAVYSFDLQVNMPPMLGLNIRMAARSTHYWSATTDFTDFRHR